MKHLEEKTISSDKKYAGKVIDLYVEEVELPNGQTSMREIVKHPGAVAIIAFTDEGKMLLVQQYRKAIGKVIIEVPAGKIEKGEEPSVTAKRELEEETGYMCESVHPLASFYTSPGFADEIIHLYIAEKVSQLETQHLDDDEFIDVLEVTLEEALELVKTQKIHDAKSMYAIQYWQSNS